MADATEVPKKTAVKAETDDDDDEEDLFGGGDEDNGPAATTESEVKSEPAADATKVEPSDSSTAPKPKANNGTAAPLQPSATIPRIQAAANPPPAPAKVVAAAGGAAGPASYGLPQGVNIPPSVQPTLLQGRLLETLRSLPVQLINDALTEYDDAVQIKGGAIRNHGAYLFGVIKRYVSVQERAQAGEGQGILPMGPELTPVVNARLQKLVFDGFCSEEEMNEKVKSKIRMLSEKDALFAIDELASVERRQIRNFGSYFMGILNRYMRGESSSFKKQEDKKRMHHQQDGRPPMRFDDRRRDDPFHRQEPDHRRGREPMLHDRNESYRRERSRDRYDQDRRRDPPNDWREQYDPRRQNPSYPGQNPPPPMGGIPGNPPPPPPRNNPPGLPGNNQYSLQQPPRMMQPPQQMYAQPPHLDQSRFVPPPGGPPPSSSPYGQQPGPHHAPSHGPPGMGSPYGNPQAIVSSPYGNPQTGMGSSQPYRGKPPSNSYGVPMNQQPMAGSQPPQSYNNNRYSQPPSQVPGGWQNPQGGSQNQQQGHGGLSVDILGLADKAASAVQALQSQNRMQGPPGAHPMRQQAPAPHQQGPPPHMQHGGMPPQQMPMQQNYSSLQGQKSMAARRRTTATMLELPVTVQYAVQNLQATGQIDGPLDDGMLGMVKDLPENLALQALQKFATIDKNTMRNKTAYLAGVLRRELEKINRR